MNNIEFSASSKPQSLFLYGDKSISRKHLELLYLGSGSFKDEKNQQPLLCIGFDGQETSSAIPTEENWRIKDLGSKFGSKLIIQRAISTILNRSTFSSSLVQYESPFFCSEISLNNSKTVDFSLHLPSSMSQLLDLSILTVPIGGVNSFLRMYSMPIRICNTRLVKEDKRFLKVFTHNFFFIFMNLSYWFLNPGQSQAVKRRNYQ